MLNTGFSAVIGFWNTRPAWVPRTSRILSSSSASRFTPLSSTEPDSIRPGGATSRSTDMAVTLLPEPDSPTRPSVSPRPTVNDTPSTAVTVP